MSKRHQPSSGKWIKSKRFKNSNKSDQYQDLLTSFFEKPESMVLIWSKSLKSYNALTEKRYRSSNQTVLGSYRLNNPFSGKYFATWDQVKAMDGHVKKGARSIPLRFFQESANEENNTPMKLSWFSVFNLADCSGPGIEEFLRNKQHEDETSEKFLNIWSSHNFSNPTKFLQDLVTSLNISSGETDLQTIRNIHHKIKSKIEDNKIAEQEKKLLAMFVLCRIFLAFHETGYGEKVVSWEHVAFVNELKQLIMELKLSDYYSKLRIQRKEITKVMKLVHRVGDLFNEVVQPYNQMQIRDRCFTIQTFINSCPTLAQSPSGPYFLNGSDVFAPIIKQIHPVLVFE
jgi:hypothetical protein